MRCDLVDRLRGIYTIPVNDGVGLLDGKDTFTRAFQTPPIQHAAAEEIVRLRGVVEKTKMLRSIPGCRVCNGLGQTLREHRGRVVEWPCPNECPAPLHHGAIHSHAR